MFCATRPGVPSTNASGSERTVRSSACCPGRTRSRSKRRRCERRRKPSRRHPHTAAAQAVLNPTSRLFALRAELDRRVAAAGLGGVSGLVTRLQTALGAVERAELDALASEVQGVIGEMETLRDDLAALATLKSRLRA